MRATVRVQGRRSRRTEGWLLVRVPLRDAATGKLRDLAESRATFAAEPWAKRARYLGFMADHHLFERPPT